MSKLEFQHKLMAVQQQINQQLDRLLPLELEFGDTLYVEPILSAMRYSTLGKGKRLRPLLIHLFSELFPIPETTCNELCLVVELFHNYTLIHDDLPAMDNDDYRRGAFSCHKQFDEATAILAGNSLLVLAFELLSKLSETTAEQKCLLIQRFCQMSGYTGIMFGQSLDLRRNPNKPYSIEQELFLDSKKTGELFKFCCQASYLLQPQIDHAILTALASFALNFGIMFQLIDDLTDQEYRMDRDIMFEKINQANQAARKIITSLPSSGDSLNDLLDFLIELIPVA